MGQRKTFRSELRACAVEQHGYVTTDDALRLGVPDEVLERLVDRGDLVSVGEDIFRLGGAPSSRQDALAEAVPTRTSATTPSWPSTAWPTTNRSGCGSARRTGPGPAACRAAGRTTWRCSTAPSPTRT